MILKNKIKGYMGDGHKRSLIYARCQNHVTYLQRMSLKGDCGTAAGRVSLQRIRVLA